MEPIILSLKRKTNNATTCEGILKVDINFFTNTIEPRSKKLNSEMTESYILKNKDVNKTAIPTGIYKIIKKYSPTFHEDRYYLEDVKGFCFIMLHEGSDYRDTKGCILLGIKNKLNTLTMSKATVLKFNDKMAEYMTKGHEVFLQITEEF